jgi:hypothetical protein
MEFEGVRIDEGWMVCTGKKGMEKWREEWLVG